MTKGFIFSLETLLVFTAWLFILLLVWQVSQQIAHEKNMQWKNQKTLGLSLIQSETLVRQHHANPWFGCAVYSPEKRRVKEYVVSQTCLEKLSQYDPSNFVYRVAMLTPSEKKILWEKPIVADAICSGIEKIVILEETQTIARLEVTTCEA